VANRLRVRLGTAGAWAAPLLVQQLPWRAQVAPAALRPVDDIASMASYERRVSEFMAAHLRHSLFLSSSNDVEKIYKKHI